MKQTAKAKKRTIPTGTPLQNQDVRTCFAIMPFRIKTDPKKGDRLNFDTKVYNNIIVPAMEIVSKGGIPIRVERADKILRAGWIHERMIQFIADADVAVVDITTLNPNVFYELGVRHALRDRVTVLIRRGGTDNPFNIGGLVAIDYDVKKPGQARRAIAAVIRNGLLSSARDSLVYSVLPELKMQPPLREIPKSSVEEYPVPSAPGKRIGIVTGSLRHVNLTDKLRTEPIDVWVNSENISMLMARVYETSTSALIRYLGARRDETGAIIEDMIGDELKKKMGDRQIVNPGDVVVTGAGRLRETHQVQQIFHAASVYGVVGSGFFPIAKVEQCVTNALSRMDFDPMRRVHRSEGHNAKKGELTSILFPVLGSGTARADLIPSARKQALAAMSYLQSRAEFTRVRRVYFMALTEEHRAALRVAFSELQIIVPGPPPTSVDAPRRPARRRRRGSKAARKARVRRV